jgi:hypothetical protein
VVLPDITSLKRVLRGFLVWEFADWGKDVMVLIGKLELSEFRVLGFMSELKRCRNRWFLRKAMDIENGKVCSQWRSQDYKRAWEKF